MGLIRWLLLGLAIAIVLVGLVFAGLLGSGLGSQDLTAAGTYIYGVATAVLALAAVIGGGLALYQWQEQLELRRRQTDLDVANLHQNVVNLLKEKLDRVRGTPEAQAVEAELDQAETEYEAILRGMVMARPELVRAKREFIMEYMEVILARLGRL